MECVITHGPNGLWDVCFLCQAHNFNVYTNVHQHRHRPESYMYKCAHVCRSVGFILFRRNQTRRNVCKLRVVTSVAFFFSLFRCNSTHEMCKYHYYYDERLRIFIHHDQIITICWYFFLLVLKKNRKKSFIRWAL